MVIASDSSMWSEPSRVKIQRPNFYPIKDVHTNKKIQRPDNIKDPFSWTK